MTAAPNCTSHHCYSPQPSCPQRKRRNDSFTYAQLYYTVKTSTFINSAHLFHILHDKMGSMHKAPLLPNKWSQGKSLLQLFELWAELAAFLLEHHLPFLLERTTDKLWFFRVGYMADIFLKMNKDYHFKENNWQYLLPKINTSFQAMIWALENCYLPPRYNFPIFKPFWWDWWW